MKLIEKVKTRPVYQPAAGITAEEHKMIARLKRGLMSRLSRRELLNGSLPAVLAAYLDGPMARRALAHAGGGKARWPKPSMEELAESSGTGFECSGAYFMEPT